MDNNELIKEIESAIEYLLFEIRASHSEGTARAIVALIGERNRMRKCEEEFDRLMKENTVLRKDRSRLAEEKFKLEQRLLQYSSKKKRNKFFNKS